MSYPTQVRFLPGPGIDPFSCRPNNTVDKVVENQKPSILRMYDALPFSWVGQNIEYVFAMIESTSKQIIPNMSWLGVNGRTRANVSQTSLAIIVVPLSTSSAIRSCYDRLNLSRRWRFTVVGQPLTNVWLDEFAKNCNTSPSQGRRYVLPRTV